MSWRRWTSIALSEIHVAHPVAHFPLLKLLQSLFKILNVSPRLSDLTVDARGDGSICRCLPHVVGGIYDLTLALYLAIKILNSRVVGHGCDVASLVTGCVYGASGFDSMPWVESTLRHR